MNQYAPADDWVAARFMLGSCRSERDLILIFILIKPGNYAVVGFAAALYAVIEDAKAHFEQGGNQ